MLLLTQNKFTAAQLLFPIIFQITYRSDDPVNEVIEEQEHQNAANQAGDAQNKGDALKKVAFFYNFQSNFEIVDTCTTMLVFGTVFPESIRPHDDGRSV